MRIKLVIVFIFTALLATFCYFNYLIFYAPYQSTLENTKLIPELNENPKYHIILKGHIDPELQKLFPLKWDIAYFGIKSICPQFINEFEGVVAPRQVHEFIYTKPDKKGNFLYMIYLDKYLPGYCRWSIGGVSYYILGTLDQGLVYFSRKKSGDYKKQTTIDVIFRKNKKTNKLHVIKSGLPLFNDILTSEIYDHDSYELTVNLLIQKEAGSRVTYS